MALPTQQTCPERDATLQGAGFDTDQGFASPLAPHSVCTAVTEGTRRHFEGDCNVEHPSDLRLQHMVDAPGQKLTQSGTGGELQAGWTAPRLRRRMHHRYAGC